MTLDKKIEKLKKIPLTRALPDETLRLLLQEGNDVYLSPGEILFEENSTGKTMFIILDGEVEVFKKNTILGVRGEGEYFGEMALIENQPRSASVKAITQCTLFEFGQKLFHAYFVTNPNVLPELLKTLSIRTRADMEILDWGYHRLRLSEENYRNIVETVSDIIFQVDLKGNILFTNSSVQVIGWNPMDLVGVPIQSILQLDESKATWGQILTKRVAHRSSANLEVFLKVRERSSNQKDQPLLLPMLLDAYGVWDETKEIVQTRGTQKSCLGTLLVVRNITEQKRLEENLRKQKSNLEQLVECRTTELEKAKIEAERANNAKSQFLSHMSHELRTPLNAISGFGQLMKLEGYEAFTADQKSNLNQILSASDHLLLLINEILDLAKIESQKISIDTKSIPLETFLEDIVALLKPLATAKSIDLIFEKKENPMYVKADPLRLKQVLINIITNAIKYNRKKGKVFFCMHAIPANQIRLEISDTGYGISAEDQEKIFDPFQRIESEEVATESGTGIGLTITKTLVELMDGTLELTSTLGEGSCFAINLPLGENQNSS